MCVLHSCSNMWHVTVNASATCRDLLNSLHSDRCRCINNLGFLKKKRKKVLFKMLLNELSWNKHYFNYCMSYHKLKQIIKKIQASKIEGQQDHLMLTDFLINKLCIRLWWDLCVRCSIWTLLQLLCTYLRQFYLGSPISEITFVSRGFTICTVYNTLYP